MTRAIIIRLLLHTLQKCIYEVYALWNVRWVHYPKEMLNPITIPTYYIISPMSFFNCEKNPLVLNSRDSKMKSFYYLCTSLSTRHTHLILLNFVGLTREIELSILSVGAATFWNLPPWLPIGPNNYFLAFIISGYWY